MRVPFLSFIGAALSCALITAMPAAWADDSSGQAGTQSSADGLQITPEMLTPTNTTAGTSNATTLGLDYKYQKTLAVGAKIEDQLPTCGAGCSSLFAANGQLSATGKVAANSKVNVGDLLDFSGTFGSEYYYLGEVPLPGQERHGLPFTADNTASLKLSLEEGPRLSTTQYTYGVSTSANLVPIGGPTWFELITWPTVVLEAARIDPTKDTQRKAVDPGLSEYNRWHVRVGSGVKLGSFDGRVIKFNFRYDHWQEFDPSQAIVAAHLNAQTYRAFSLLLAGKGKDPDWIITYSSGSVPTDKSDAQVWQLGWNWKFN